MDPIHGCDKKCLTCCLYREGMDLFVTSSKEKKFDGSSLKYFESKLLLEEGF